MKLLLARLNLIVIKKICTKLEDLTLHNYPKGYKK
jgi:hypothetical protein